MRRVLLAVLMASLVTACAVGRKQDFDSLKLDVSATSQTIRVAVLDHRPYVLNKNKPESFTGLSRGGFGNPFDVNTKSGQPMATDMANALASSLRAKGKSVDVVILPPTTSDAEAMTKVATSGGKGLLVVLSEWKSDHFARTTLSFNVNLMVVDPSGKSVGESRAEGTEDLGPGISNMDTAPVAAFGRKMQQMLQAPTVASQL